MLTLSAAEFAAALPKDGRLLGLDLGEKTIGLALSDTRRKIASAMETIRRDSFTKDTEALRRIVEEHAVGGLVLGYPVNMDGSLGPRTQATRAFANNLMKMITMPILLWDERLSTMAVERMMLEGDLSRQKRAQIVDKLAASYMLQGALDNIA